LSAASENDNTVIKEQTAPYFSHLRVWGDKILHDEKGMQELKNQFNAEAVATVVMT